ncbi:hypothetical protein S83_056240, partial [Arachis hypogaea]
MLGVGAVLPCSSSSSSELNPAIRSEVSFSVGSCLLPHPDKVLRVLNSDYLAYSSIFYLCLSMVLLRESSFLLTSLPSWEVVSLLFPLSLW